MVKRRLTAQPSTGSRPRQIANKCSHAFTQIVERWSARLPRRERLVRLGRVVPAHLLDARLGRRQLLPQRGNLGGRGAVDRNRLR